MTGNSRLGIVARATGRKRQNSARPVQLAGFVVSSGCSSYDRF